MSNIYPWPEAGAGWRDSRGFRRLRFDGDRGLGGHELLVRVPRDDDGNKIFPREVAVWKNMFDRCYRKSRPAYFYYGHRGIRVCPRWRSFYNFIEDMGPRPTDKHTIERVDNSKGYNPDNCIWATHKEQAMNKRPKSKARAARCRAFRDAGKRMEGK